MAAIADSAISAGLVAIADSPASVGLAATADLATSAGLAATVDSVAFAGSAAIADLAASADSFELSPENRPNPFEHFFAPYSDSYLSPSLYQKRTNVFIVSFVTIIILNIFILIIVPYRCNVSNIPYSLS